MAVDEARVASSPGRERILEAAIARFAAQGVDGTSIKTIATDAGVSPALIVHHFGSKAALRTACDRHVAATIRDGKRAAIAEGPSLDPLAALRASRAFRPYLRYLARTLVDGSPEVSGLIDDLVADALAYTDEGIANGLFQPSEHPRERMVVLTLWSLGLLILHEQLERLLGVDLLGETDQLGPYLLPVTEMLTGGVLAPGLYERMRDAFADQETDRS